MEPRSRQWLDAALAACVLAISLCLSARADTYWPADDTFIDESSSHSAVGAAQSDRLVVRRGGTGYQLDTLIRFDLGSMPAGSIVQSAVLRLYYGRQHGSDPAGRVLNLHKITGPWDGATAKWNNRPGHDPTATSSATVPSSFDWMEWDVTDDVQDFADRSAENYGWEIIDPATTGSFPITFFRPREWTDPNLRPTLEIQVLEPSGPWLKADPPPDVDKDAHGHTGKPTCWLATAANLLAAAGYGNGNTMQERADEIYVQMVAMFGLQSGWTSTAIEWWLGSAHNVWPSNPYDVVTTYGYKDKEPWANGPIGILVPATSGTTATPLDIARRVIVTGNRAQFIGNELRRCQFLGLSIFWPRTKPYGGSGKIGHAVTCWGDSEGPGILKASPAAVVVTDSDRETGGDVQTYEYDLYTDPNPSGYNEGNGWYIDYSDNHPFIRGIVTLCATDNPGDHTKTQKVIGSYRIGQDSLVQATGLHYVVGTDVPILSYKTSIAWDTANDPNITESDDRTLVVHWDRTDKPVSRHTWVTVTTELVVPVYNAMTYRDVHFTYPPGTTPDPFGPPPFGWRVDTPNLEPDGIAIDFPMSVPNIAGGYVVGGFDLLPMGRDTVVGQYRFVHEYDFFQDPERHAFELTLQDETPYRVANMRFGHSYGHLSEAELWEFNDWMTVFPGLYDMFSPSDVSVVLDWEGRLPYPEGENYLGQFDSPECTEYLPADLNRDCRVDFRDCTILADQWLQRTTVLP